MKSKLIVGLTGIFGSGKSTVANLFEELGAEVVNADTLAHEALWKGSPVYEKAAALFPKVSATREGLNRKQIGEIVFKDPVKRKQLEKLVHPYVRQRIEQEIVAAEENVVVLEIPLLYEAGFDWFCDAIVVASASQDVIEKRLKQQGFSEEEIKDRHAAQMSLSEKCGRADYVVDNSKSLKETKQQVGKLWKKLRESVKTNAD